MAQIKMNNEVTFEVTTPKEMGGNTDKLSELIKKFEREFEYEEKGMKKYHIVISTEEENYNDLVLAQVREVYLEAGWKGCTVLRSEKTISLHLI